MATKQTKRGRDSGVIVTVEIGESEITLVFHDAARAGERERWEDVRLFTEKSLSRAAFVDRTLRRDDFEAIGFHVVNRLCALAGLEPSSAPASAPTRTRRIRKRR